MEEGGEGSLSSYGSVCSIENTIGSADKPFSQKSRGGEGEKVDR